MRRKPAKKWPDKITPFPGAATDGLQKRLAERYGQPARYSKRGITGINERFFAELLKAENHITHEATEERFYLYNATNGLWQPATAHSLKSKLSDRMRVAETDWNISSLHEQDTEHNRRNIISLLRGIVEHRDFFRDRPHAIHATNCMLVFENNKVVKQDFAPEFLSRNQLGVAYDPDAVCPRFQNELLTPALSPDDLAVVQKMFGLLVLGRNRPQRIFILIGPGGSGKTTTGLVVQGLIGQQNCVELRTQHLDGRFELARLVDKTLVFGLDVAADFLMSKGAHRLKSIVGGDPLVAERKNSNETFPFKGDLNALVTANEDLLVRLHGDYDRTAWQRRLCPILYSREPIKPIPFFDRLLVETEGSGILNFALSGLAKYYQDEAATGSLVLSAEQLARIDKLLTQSEGFRTFIRSELVAKDGADISVEELLEAFGDYAKRQDWRVPRRQTLQEQAQDLIFQIWNVNRSNSLERDGKAARGYRGLKLRKQDDNDPTL